MAGQTDSVINRIAMQVLQRNCVLTVVKKIVGTHLSL